MTRNAADIAEEQISKLRSATSGFAALGNFADRLEDLRVLIDAHQRIGGTGAGRREERIAALNRAALVLLASQFQGFVADVFAEAWRAKYGSSPDAMLDRVRLNNALPKEDIDPLFSFLAVDAITATAEVRPSVGSMMPPRRNAVPAFVRPGERSQHQVRAVLTELTRVRNHIAHGGRGVPVRLSDVMGYLIDCVHLATAMARVLRTRGVIPVS